MLQQLLSLFLSPLAGVLVIVVVLIVGFLVGVKGHTTMTIPHVAAGVISTPVAAVGALGTVIALAVDPTILAASIVTVLVALTASTMAILTKVGENKKAAREDAAELAIELAKISRSVDGVATRRDDEVSALKKENAELRLRLAEAKGTAAILAAGQTAIEIAKASASSAPASAMSESAPAKSLEQIDKNTAETANNTARTEAVVQDLKDKA